MTRPAWIHPDWWQIICRAWSVRFMVLATLLGCLEALLPFYAEEFPRGVFALLTVAASLAALIARLVAQKNLL